MLCKIGKGAEREEKDERRGRRIEMRQ